MIVTGAYYAYLRLQTNLFWADILLRTAMIPCRSTKWCGVSCSNLPSLGMYCMYMYVH